MRQQSIGFYGLGSKTRHRGKRRIKGFAASSAADGLLIGQSCSSILMPRHRGIGHLSKSVGIAPPDWWSSAIGGYVCSDLRTMTRVWMGLTTVAAEEGAGKLILIGNPSLKRTAQHGSVSASSPRRRKIAAPTSRCGSPSNEAGGDHIRSAAGQPEPYSTLDED